MKNKSSVLLVLIGSLVWGAAAVHANRTGGDAYPFLKIGLGARAMAMGGAFVSLADDGTAPYWNPAGMGLDANMEKRQAAFMGAFVGQDEFDRSHTFFSVLYPKPPLPWMRSANLGLSLISVGVKDIPHTADDGSGGLLRLGSFNDSQWALALSYGRSMFLSQGKSMFYVGGGAKYIRHTLGVTGGTGWGWGVDFGIIGDVNVIFRKQDEALFRIFHNLKMGVVFHKNFDLRWSGGHTDDDPVSGVLGLSFEPVKVSRWQWIIATDFHRTEAQPIWISLGNEFGLKAGKNSIFLRGGMNKFYLQGAGSELTRGELSLDREITYGVGLKIDQLQALRFVVDFGFVTGRFESRGRTSLAISF